MTEAIAVLEQGMPEVLIRFTRALAADPEWSLSKAAQGVGQPGKGSQMMMDPRVKKLFLAMQQDLREQFKDARKDNILKLLILSEYDPADAFGDDNVILPMKQIPAECRVAIKKYRYRPDGSYEVDFIDRVAVIRLLMEAFGDVDSKVNAVGGIAQVHFHGRVLR